MANKILIVDDEVDITLFLKKALEKRGFTVITFNDSQKALADFTAGTYDLVLLDIRMAKIDGFELYQHLQTIDKKAKVCFMTAFEVYYDALKDLFPDSYESICFIRKPFAIDDFVRKIKTRIQEQ